MKAADHSAIAAPRWSRIGVIVATTIGCVMVILALAALGHELVGYYETGTFRPIAAGEYWFKLDVGSLNFMQAIIQRYIHPFLWDPIIAGVLQWPAWSLLGGFGVALAFAFPIRRG